MNILTDKNTNKTNDIITSIQKILEGEGDATRKAILRRRDRIHEDVQHQKGENCEKGMSNVISDLLSDNWCKSDTNLNYQYNLSFDDKSTDRSISLQENITTKEINIDKTELVDGLLPNSVSTPFTLQHEDKIPDGGNNNSDISYCIHI